MKNALVALLLAGFLNTVHAVPCDISGRVLGVYTYTLITTNQSQHAGDACLGVTTFRTLIDPGSLNIISNQIESKAHAVAVTFFGVNQASVSGTVIPVVTRQLVVDAWSIWTEKITITGGIGPGEVIFGANISGNWSSPATTSAEFSLFIGEASLTNPFTFVAASRDPNVASLTGHVSLTYEFTYDVPFDLTGRLMVSGFIDCVGPCGARDSFSANFANSAILDTVILPPGATLHTLSGATLPPEVGAAAVPEPGTTLLMLAGLGVLGFSARRRRPAGTTCRL